MRTSSFSFDLPERLIAQHPSPARGESRMLVLERESGNLQDSRIMDLPLFLGAGTLMVLNDTRVRPARLRGMKEPAGGRADFLLLKEEEPGLWTALVDKSKRQRAGQSYCFPGEVRGRIEGGETGTKLIRFEPPIDEAYLERYGHVPLPPYIRREDTGEDRERYQTVYARVSGSAAAPTAGLHLTAGILSALKEKGVEVRCLTLEVGLGTFLPIHSLRIEEHRMHREGFHIPEDTALAVTCARREGRPVLAVGTTVVRALESSWRGNEVIAGAGSTDLFISPGYRFQAVSRLLTNFHTPCSSLLVLVCAFAGRRRILESYDQAARRGYRFFSYGDAMLIL